MNWRAGFPRAGARVLVKNIQGFDPFRIFGAVCRNTKRGLEMQIQSENVVLRGRELRGVLHVQLAR